MKLVFTILTLAASMSPALVREQASCSTSDNHYSVTVTENQGSGPVRPSPGEMVANVYDIEGATVLTVPVEIYRGFQSISFGRPLYRDIETAGDVLKLEGPSTNFKNYILTVDSSSGLQISDQKMSCTVFFGEIL